MFCEIPKADVLATVCYALQHIRGVGDPDTLSFAIAKWQLKELDQLGTHASHAFHAVTGAEVLRYVRFELYDNCSRWDRC